MPLNILHMINNELKSSLLITVSPCGITRVVIDYNVNEIVKDDVLNINIYPYEVSWKNINSNKNLFCNK